MKLAEALILRADLQKRIVELKTRLIRSAKVQEGDKPHENPEVMLKELDNCASELTSIIQKVNKTNSVVKIGGTDTISDCLAQRETILLKRSVLSALIEEAATKFGRYTNSEIKIKSAVNINELQKQIDDLAVEYRRIDTKIQEYNWLTEIE